MKKMQLGSALRAADAKLHACLETDCVRTNEIGNVNVESILGNLLENRRRRPEVDDRWNRFNQPAT